MPHSSASMRNLWAGGRRRLAVWQALWSARRDSRARIARGPRRMLVVCYGNIYRSPFAATLLEQGAHAALEVRSAGFHPRAGRQTPRAFVPVAAQYGVALDAHRSRVIDRESVEWADAVVIMDRHNWDALGVFGPAAQAKAVWLGAFAADGGGREIDDPYGTDAKKTQAITARLYAATQELKRALSPSNAPNGEQRQSC